MPNIDLETTHAGTVTPAEFEQRKSKLRHLDGYSKGIVKAVRESLEADRSDPKAQERLGRETFSAELARLHLDPGSLDHDLALAWPTAALDL